jgi:hypothetical protein
VTPGGRECSARAGTLMARSTLPKATVLQGQRGGICDEGTTARSTFAAATRTGKVNPDGVGNGAPVSPAGRLRTAFSRRRGVLSAQIVARAQKVPRFLTHVWKAYTALLQIVGVMYHLRHCGEERLRRCLGRGS